MAETRPALRAVDRLEVTILMDNSIDVFLPDTEEVRRTRLPSELPWGDRKALVRAWLLGAGERSRSRPLGDSSL
jgi:hypothetical protein